MEVQTKNREAISAPTISPEREEEFTRLAEYAPAYFAYLDPGLRYLFVSKQFEKLVGIPRERLIGKLVSEIVGEESFALLKPQFEIALSGQAASTETFLPDYADRKRRLERHIWPDVGSDGNVQGLYIFIHDLTKTHHINKELLATERRLLRVLGAASVVPWEADPQTWRFTYVGSQAEKILGYPLDQWYEKEFWTSTIFPEDREFAINFCETSSKTLSDFEFEYRMVRADGDVIWLRDIVHVDIEDGVPQVLRGFMIDITAIKREEETLKIDRDLIAERFDQQSEKLAGIIAKSKRAEKKALLERRGGVVERLYAIAPVGFCHFDTDLRYQYINEWLARINGVPVDAHLGKTIDEVLKDVAAGVVPELRRVLETGEPVIDGEVKAETPAHPEESRHYVHSFYPDKSNDGTVVGVSCVVQDITDRKRAQEALRQSRDQLERLVQNRTQELRAANETLTATEQQLRSKAISLHTLTGKLIAAQEDERRRIGRELHDDFTQRLAALAIEAGKAEQHAEATDGRDKDMLRKIKERLMELSENVQALSRQVHPAIVEDLGIADALHSLCEELEQNEGVRIDCQADGVSADIPNDQALCIYRVAQEALRNIVKHSRATQTQVHLHSKKGTLELQVRDNGVGFDVNEVKNRNGLGLHSIEERVSFVGGTVRLETGPGDGTVISVSIPLT